MFINVWNSRGRLNFPIHNYLLRSVQNRCLNHIRTLHTRERVLDEYREELLAFQEELCANDDDPLQLLEIEELKERGGTVIRFTACQVQSGLQKISVRRHVSARDCRRASHVCQYGAGPHQECDGPHQAPVRSYGGDVAAVRLWQAMKETQKACRHISGHGRLSTLFYKYIGKKKRTYLNASTSSGVNGIFLPKRRAPVSVIR